MVQSPCYKCTYRRIGCHGKCTKYRKYKAERAKEANEEKEAKKADSMLTDFRMRSIDRVKRQNGNTNKKGNGR